MNNVFCKRETKRSQGPSIKPATTDCLKKNIYNNNQNKKMDGDAGFKKYIYIYIFFKPAFYCFASRSHQAHLTKETFFIQKMLLFGGLNCIQKWQIGSNAHLT